MCFVAHIFCGVFAKKETCAVFNKTLSTNRAKAVYEYVLQKGGNVADKLSYKGYGDSKPKVPNDTPENKAKNRRTELKIISK